MIALQCQWPWVRICFAAARTILILQGTDNWDQERIQLQGYIVSVWVSHNSICLQLGWVLKKKILTWRMYYLNKAKTKCGANLTSWVWKYTSTDFLPVEDIVSGERFQRVEAPTRRCLFPADRISDSWWVLSGRIKKLWQTIWNQNLLCLPEKWYCFFFKFVPPHS